MPPLLPPKQATLCVENEILKDLFLSFAKYEFVEYSVIFQNILYFCGISHKEINFPNTYKLNWKIARKFWDMGIIKTIQEYKPIGVKPIHDNKFTKVNKLLEKFDVDLETLRSYSYVLSRLVECIKILFNIRKRDILKRRNKVKLINQERENKKNLFDEREKKLEEDYEVAKEIEVTKASEEEREFNEEEFRLNFVESFNLKVPTIIVYF